MSTVYIYLDKSGNLDFADSGTKHFVLCAMITPQVLKTHGLLHQLKHKLLEQGNDIENFHATEDKQAVRNQVFRTIAAGDHLEFHGAWILKFADITTSIMHPRLRQWSESLHSHLANCA